MLDGMTNIKASEVIKELKDYTEDLPHYSPDEYSCVKCGACWQSEKYR